MGSKSIREWIAVVVAAIGCVAVVALAAGACGPSFDPYWRVQDFRLLGIRAEPVTLEPGESAELSALVHAPDDADVSYEWSWCPVDPPAQQRYECPLGQLAGGSDAGGADAGGGDAGGGRPGGFDSSFFELGDGATASLRYPGTADQILEFCRAIRDAVAGESSGALAGAQTVEDCSRGYDISVRLTAESGGRSVTARKQLTLSTGGDAANRNPAHDGLAIRVAEAADISKVRGRVNWPPPDDRPRDEQWVTVPDDEPLRLVGGVPYDMRAAVFPESAENYIPPSPRGAEDDSAEPRRERLSFRWFVTDGDLERAQRVFVPGSNPLRRARTTGWVLPESCPESSGSCTVRIWSVVRDGRLGVDWASGRFELLSAQGGGS